MRFLSFDNTNITFSDERFILKSYTIIKPLSITCQIEIIS